MISREMTVARLLDEHPALLAVLVDYHPHFKQLRNRLLRRVMAPRISVSQAARIAGVPEQELLDVLHRALGQQPEAPAAAAAPSEEPTRAPKPPRLEALPAWRRVEVDVREDIRLGKEPFARIMAAVKGLRPGEVLVLRAPFEPIPLYDVLGKRGFGHWTEQAAADEWLVWFYREPSIVPPSDSGGEPRSSDAATPALVLDVRGLEPPQPMVRVLEALETLGAGQRLEVLHDRRPLFLYPQLEAQGCAHQTEELRPGLVRITITRG